jgi:hypothetical protein
MNPMHKELVILSLIIMFVGQGMALYANPVISEYRTVEGIADRHESQDQQHEYEQFLMIQTAGIALFILGMIMILVFIMAIYIRHYQGTLVPFKDRKNPALSNVRICTSCTRRIPPDSIMCPYCGAQ